MRNATKLVLISGMLLAQGFCLVRAHHGEQRSETAPASPKKSIAKKAKKKKMTYRCPMDGYESDKPGKCPKCGMNLEKKQTTKQ